MTTNDTDQLDDTPPSASAGRSASAAGSPGKMLIASLRGHRRIVRGVGILAVAAIIGAAYVVGGPPVGAHSDTTTFDSRNALTAQSDQKGLQLSGPIPAATAAPAPAAPAYAGDGSLASGGTTTGTGQAAVVSSLDATQIVKTGQMSLEVAGIDDAVGRAQAAIAGLGGVVDSSNRYGTGDNTIASITFRVPVAKWDEALADMRKIASKILSEQTGATDVTTQVVDIDARLSNLQATETALQAIMARASAIPDVLAVENQLSDTQGQIEELTAESKHLKDQAAMSTLSVSFQLPSKTVTTAATEDWTLAGQIDQAGAALVRIGQGLATIGVWIVVVVLPVALVLAVLLAIGLVFRRVRGRGRRGQVAAA
jgi:hypothetical protein